MKRYKIFNSILLALSVVICIPQISCKKLVEVDSPDNAINGGNVYSTDATAAGVLTAFYANMSTGTTSLAFATGSNSISVQSGLSSDEFVLWNGLTVTQLVGQFQNKLTNTVNPPFWNNFYSFVYKINDAIEGLTKSTSLTPAVKTQLLGEAKFLRGLCYFYLVNMYGDVPLAVTTDYAVNAAMKRTDKSKVWQQIILDLQEARDLLNSNYVSSGANSVTTERVRPNKAAAAALLARAYLYNSDWANAEAQATSVIDNKALYDTVSVNNTFLKNSKEAIWQLQPVNLNWNTEDARIFALSTAPSGFSYSKFIYLSPSQFNSFETGDLRKTNWVGTYTDATGTYGFPNKYKSASSGASVVEYLMVLRLGEQYLIRSEARAQQGKLAEAKADLNVIRTRAGLPNTTANDKDALLAAILHERQTELFSEWGHRWFDLIRTGNADAVMTAAVVSKGGTWDKRWKFYPIPIWDIQKNPLLDQNDGY